MELPGVYVNADRHEVFAIDHVNSKIVKKGLLAITNTTPNDAVVKVLVETSEMMKKPLGTNAHLNWRRVEIKSGSTVQLKY